MYNGAPSVRRRLVRLALGAAVLLGASGLPQVQAHLTGAFSTYLAAVYNKDTTQQLQEEIASTQAQIAEMVPRLEEMERTFDADRKLAGERLLEWYNGGLDMWAALLLSDDTAADVLASQWLVERQLERELVRLQALYVQYLQVGLTKEALSGHERLLHIIEANLAMREPYLASMGEIDLETQAYYMDIDWTAEVEDELIAALSADRELIDGQWREWLSVSEADDLAQFTESWLNERSAFEYHFRQDHIYAVFSNDFANVILVAQMIGNERRETQFVIEGAFFNGFMVPEAALAEMAELTFRLSRDAIGEEIGAGGASYLEQQSGRFVWKVDR